MKILHVVPTYLPATRYGGPIQSVHGLARAQAGLGHDVHVATTSVDGSADSAVPLGRTVDVDGVAVRYFRSPTLRRLYWSPSMADFFDRRVGDFDVCHLHSVFLWPTNRVARSAARAGVPYLVSPRGMLDPELIRRRSRLLKTVWIRLFEKWTIEHAATVHFTSHSEERACRAVGLRPRSVVILPNGFDPQEVVDTPPEHSRSPYALYFGRVSWKKGIDRLIRAMPQIQDLRLVVAGNDEEGLTSTLQRLASDLRIDRRVEFQGPVSGATKWALLRGARCLVLPSRSENFGNVVLEALAADCPVVVTPEVGVVEYLDGACLVTAAEPELLAAAVLRLHRDEALRERHRCAGRRILAESFSWTGIAQRMIETYASVCAPRRAA